MTLTDTPHLITGTIAGTPIHTAAWTCLNPQVILGSAPTLGDNVVLDGVDGTLPCDFQDTERTEDLWFLLTGNIDEPFAGGPAAALAAVKRLFTAAFREADRDSRGCVELDLVDVDGTPVAGLVQIRDQVFSVDDDDSIECRASLTVLIPRGKLEAAGS